MTLLHFLIAWGIGVVWTFSVVVIGCALVLAGQADDLMARLDKKDVSRTNPNDDQPTGAAL